MTILQEEETKKQSFARMNAALWTLVAAFEIVWFSIILKPQVMILNGVQTYIVPDIPTGIENILYFMVAASVVGYIGGKSISAYTTVKKNGKTGQ